MIWLQVTLIAFYAIVIGLLGMKEWRRWKQKLHLRNHLYENPIWVRDSVAGRQAHALATMQLWEACKREDRPMVITFLRSPNGDGVMLASSPTGWTQGRDYSKGEGLELLQVIAGVFGMMELNTHTNVISTLEVLLQREHDRVMQEKAINTLTDTTN